MKVIFLDIDGVLNCKNTADCCEGYIGVDNKKVELLKRVVDETGALIVLSSSWRLGVTNTGLGTEGLMDYLKEKLAKYGLEIYSMTPQIGGFHGSRGKEIDIWLNSRDNIESWVVLDDEYFDDFSVYGIDSHLVNTDFYGDGLTKEDVEQAIYILNGENNYDFE